ncbi:MAG: hopanoid biosynthesis associated radical SAM protein HpnH [Acidobacteria bacterium]|nr:MAG: hopanoid biosynthesis associated radical SAM protein HpnH [Acidobacteriota bacterium]
MRFPLHITIDSIRHQIRNAIHGNRRYPMVLMLEPLYTCNLACVGCSIERHTGKLEDRTPIDRCLDAVEKSGAPIVSICGGEPTIYPELPELISGIIHRKRHIYLCTNALLLDSKVYGRIEPHKRLTINVHLDGTQKTHDEVCDREGVFDKALDMIKEGKRLGYHVTTNTTIFKDTDVSEIEELCRIVKGLGVDGMLISPGYHYESVERNIFLTRKEIHEKFKRVLELSKTFRLQSTPMYLEFVAGMREYRCSPWSTVTFTPLGWKGPCYLIGKQYSQTWEEFWNTTDWDYWESRRDRLCQNCLMHSGFEASALFELKKSPKDMARMAAWNFLG